MRPRFRGAVVAALCLLGLAASPANADVFNGRIGFTSFRVDHDPGPGTLFDGDIFTMTPQGTDERQLTTDPALDAQSDWSPDGTVLAYRIRKPGSRINFEVARMPAGGGERTILTASPTGVASSMPSWFPDGQGLLYRVSGSGLQSEIWSMTPAGDEQRLLFPLAGSQWYPSFSPDMRKVVFATTLSPVGDTDRGIFTASPDGTDVRLVFDVPGVMDTGPAWSPDGRIAFESDANIDGGNPEGDREIFIIGADGTGLTQLTRNADHDEGAAFSPDGQFIVYSTGPDEFHGDIHVMTSAGAHVRQLTEFEGRDESPDWQTIPAPETDVRCGDLAGTGVRDVRAAGRRVPCWKALWLAERWLAGGGQSATIGRFEVEDTDFGGTRRLTLTRPGRHPGRDRLVVFLFEPVVA